MDTQTKMNSPYNFDALTDAFENLPLARRKWVKEHWDEMMSLFACKMYDYVEEAVPKKDNDSEEDEGKQTLTEWLQGELFAELCHMPLWTLAAFGFLSDGDVLKNSDVRIILIKDICCRHKKKAPSDLLERNKKLMVADFIPVVKMAVFQSKKILNRLADESSPSDAAPPFA